MTRCLRLFEIDADLLVGILSEDWWFRCQNIPVDAKLVDCGYDQDTRKFRLTLEHPTFQEHHPCSPLVRNQVELHRCSVALEHLT